MIYMVDTVYDDPGTEAAWHEYYAGYLLKLLTVPGFLTAQRFKAAGAPPSRYLAMYTVASAAVYDSPVYKSIGGGGSQNLRFRGAYKSWTRNLFDGLAFAPRVAEEEFVFSVDCESPEYLLPGCIGDPLWLKSVGLQMTTKYRALAVLGVNDAHGARESGRGFVYAPITRQLISVVPSEEAKPERES